MAYCHVNVTGNKIVTSGHAYSCTCLQCVIVEYMALEWPVIVWREFCPHVGVNTLIAAELPLSCPYHHQLISVNGHSEGRMSSYGNCKLNALPEIHYSLYYCVSCQYINSLCCAGKQVASNTFSMNVSKVSNRVVTILLLLHTSCISLCTIPTDC